MKTNKSPNFLILLGILLLATFIRIVLRSNQYIDNIIAGINIISLWFVVYLILEKSKRKFIKRLKQNKIIGIQTKIKKRTHFNFVINIIKVIIFIMGLLYMFIFANAITNDIISFISLFLSIEEKSIYNFIQDIFYKKK